ncbi:hypothetical protein KO527_02315 [Pseudoalteromonas sp. C2R02]|uniref:hypothetical protein n=1 Tax=Pseudoalteromonas sp. C2R02 TaxID=2841565 RepID=UPI001C09F51B|nr:hypothetical protein [Pseudoalteromonas sp. C2R02]MBU2968190.1 hypothetical protein [Pseudoalteromonas sp. C2R02]
MKSILTILTLFLHSFGANASILSDCEKKWGTDYVMVKYCVNRQTKAYNELYGSKPPVKKSQTTKKSNSSNDKYIDIRKGATEIDSINKRYLKRKISKNARINEINKLYSRKLITREQATSAINNEPVSK